VEEFFFEIGLFISK